MGMGCGDTNVLNGEIALRGNTAAHTGSQVIGDKDDVIGNEK